MILILDDSLRLCYIIVVLTSLANCMNYRRLGRTNLMVSVVGIGTTQLRRVPERQAIETLKRAFALGVNHVNAGPDYEGADDLIVRALKESDPVNKVYLSFQAGGSVEDLHRQFEETCEKFGVNRLDLFGLGAISEQVTFGHNVWGAGGTVEFLLKKKQEGRLEAMFASDHGAPEHMKTLLERDVFDALMLAYNPLGFHIISFRPETVWQLETPPAPIQGTYHWENIPRTESEILPLAKARDVGIMVMKPLAGGLLTASKAFPPYAWREGLPQPLSATQLLRYLLMNDAVSCVVPGTSSIEEAEENARAGTGEIHLIPAEMGSVRTRAAAFYNTLCSRCGKCDDLCSKGLPVSFIFRAAYHYLYPSAPFEVSTGLQYFKLHPWEQSACETCTNRTCRCPASIDIPKEMIAIHAKMLELRDRGFVPRPESQASDWVTGLSYAMKVLSREIPPPTPAGREVVIRLQVRNTGTRPWRTLPVDGQGSVGLAVFLNGQHIHNVRLRHTVWPTSNAHFAFPVALPLTPGAHTLTMDMFEDGVGLFSAQGVPAIEETITSLPASKPLPPPSRNWIRSAMKTLSGIAGK